MTSLLSGPIDIDKMDYLARDSLHAGVPYGRNFDQDRLIGSLCLNAAGDALAITEKGKTAAEMMVFARYVMFSEVYWHHGVRSATAMLQRAFYLLHGTLDLDALFRMTEGEMVAALCVRPGPARPASFWAVCSGRRAICISGWPNTAFSSSGRSTTGWPGALIPGWRPAPSNLPALASTALGRIVAPHEVLFDAPPVEREVEFDIEVLSLKDGHYRPLGEVSPVVQTLARRAVRRLRQTGAHVSAPAWPPTCGPWQTCRRWWPRRSTAPNDDRSQTANLARRDLLEAIPRLRNAPALA